MRKLAHFALIVGVVLLGACNSDSDPEPPTLTLEQESVTATAGETVSIDVTFTTPEGFGKLEIQKKIDGIVEDTETITTEGNGTYAFEYTLEVADSDGILTFTFTVYDSDEMTATKDLVVSVNLTPTQVLLRYDWLLSEEIRELTNLNDISDAYTDDVYRFNEDGTYDKSIGDKADAFGDAWFNYCYWNFNETNSVLILTKTGAFGEDVRDTINVTKIDDTELRGNVIYRGLDAFNTGNEDVPYVSVENYEKVFAAQPKGATFDPYAPGADNDGGPAGMCNDVSF